MAEYKFTTQWRFEAAVDRVFEELARVDRWPLWWKYVAKVELLAPPDATGAGGAARMTWRTSLPYTLSFDIANVRYEPPYVLEGRASGELVGTGLWTLTPTEFGVAVRYDWFVSTTKAWMNWLAPVARPLFAWNHARVMSAGQEGLAAWLRQSGERGLTSSVG